MRSSPPIQRLVAALRRLPGIGEKSATRLAFHLLSSPEAQVHELAEAIVRLKKEIVLCAECFDLTDASPCAICRDPRRDASLVCVVEEPAAEAAIEASGRKPKARTMWPDERATYLLAKASAGDREPLVQAIKREPASLDIPLVAIWSYYRAKQLPDDTATLGRSIETIKLASPHVKDPNLGQALGELERRYATLCPNGQCPTR